LREREKKEGIQGVKAKSKKPLALKAKEQKAKGLQNHLKKKIKKKG